MSEPSIKTTVVGSYPLPAWLAAYPSVPNLRDAISSSSRRRSWPVWT